MLMLFNLLLLCMIFFLFLDSGIMVSSLIWLACLELFYLMVMLVFIFVFMFLCCFLFIILSMICLFSLWFVLMFLKLELIVGSSLLIGFLVVLSDVCFKLCCFIL